MKKKKKKIYNIEYKAKEIERKKKKEVDEKDDK